jgi:acyl-CoA thioesterase YciA
MQHISTKICKTSDIGINNNLFGGTMLAWLDETGGTFASSICNTPNMITLKIDEVLFKKPVKVNEHIRIFGQVDKIGTTSITLSLEARRFDFDTASEEIVCSTREIYVRIDNYGNSTPIDQKVRDRIQKELLNH